MPFANVTAARIVRQESVRIRRHAERGGRTANPIRQIEAGSKSMAPMPAGKVRKSIHHNVALNPGARRLPSRFSSEKPPKNSAKPRATASLMRKRGPPDVLVGFMTGCYARKRPKQDRTPANLF